MTLDFNKAKDTTEIGGAIQLTHEQVEQKVNEFVSKLPTEFHDCVVPCESFGCRFTHPFYCQPSFQAVALSGFFTPDSIVNAITSSSDAYDKFCDKGEFENALDFVYAPYRRDYLVKLIEQHGAERLLTAINAVWIGVENISEDYWLWCYVWSQVAKIGSNRLNVMDADDRKVFEALPDTVTAYRGFHCDDEEIEGEYGWSWTLDRDTAEWFARRWSNRSPMVATVIIPKSEILALFGGRNESEVVIHSDYLACSAEIKLEALSVLEVAA